MVLSVALQDDNKSKVSHYIYQKELKALPTHTFKDYPQSTVREKYIIIDGSNLTTIEPEAFMNVRLHDINIIHNELETLSKGMFVNISVRTFLLNDNKIKSIEVGNFDDVHPYDRDGAFILSLAGNRLKTIEKGIFNNLKMSGLFLQDNRIYSIEKGSFNDMPRLEFLLLSNNRLDTVDVGIFQNLGNNIHLELMKNRITYINSEAFENNTNIKIYLSGNLFQLKKDYFTNSRDIIKLVD